MTKSTLQVASYYCELIRSYCSDQDHDHDLDLNLKTMIIDQDQDQDQDRSPASSVSSEGELLYSWFRSLCREYDLDTAGLDISVIRRNIVWVKANLRQIRYPRAYLSKILAGCPVQVKPSASPVVGFRLHSSVVDEAPSDELLGVPKIEIAAKLDQYTDEVHQLLLPRLGEAMARLYPNYSSVSGSSMRLNILVAQAIKEGLL